MSMEQAEDGSQREEAVGGECDAVRTGVDSIRDRGTETGSTGDGGIEERMEVGSDEDVCDDGPRTRGPQPRKWTQRAVVQLIRIVKAEKERNPVAFRTANTAASFARWPNVARLMREAGFSNITKTDCTKKWSHLAARYRKIRDAVDKTGGIEKGLFEDAVTGALKGENYKSMWVYLELMNPIMFNHGSITLGAAQGTTPLIRHMKEAQRYGESSSSGFG